MTGRGGQVVGVVTAVGVTTGCLVNALWAVPRTADLLGFTLNPAYLVLDTAAMLAAGLSAAWWAVRRGTAAPFPPLALFVLAWPFFWYLTNYPHPAAFVVGFWLNCVLPALYVHVALTFPDGRTTRWESRFIWVAYSVPAVLQLGRFLTGDMPSFTGCDLAQCQWAPAPALASPQAHALATTAGRVGWLVIALMFAVVLVLRMRRSSPSAARRYRAMGVMSLARAGYLSLMQLFALSGSAVNGQVQLVLTWAFTSGIAVVVAAELRTDHWVAPQVVAVAEDVERGTPIRAALAGALKDPELVLGYRDGQGPGFSDEEGRHVGEQASGRVTAYLGVGHTPEAVLVHDPGVPSAAVHAVGPAVLLARRNHLLERQLRQQLGEVRASRARMVEASDVERRRIERDLHDGAQQHLLGLGLGLRVLRDRADDELAGELDDLLVDLHDALTELRNLARGIHPSLLNDVGLAGAVPALLRSLPLPVVVHHLPDVRFPVSVETTAYYVIAEAITNAVKHAHASRIDVDVEVVGETVVVEVLDDGCGGASSETGTGLRGLRDRVEAVDGLLAVTSRGGRGTSIRAEIPCA